MEHHKGQVFIDDTVNSIEVVDPSKKSLEKIVIW